MNALRSRFETLRLRAMGAGSDPSSWSLLDQGYGQEQRAYHGWAHVAAMLMDLDRAKSDPDFDGADFEAIELAVFFHDAVYDPRRPDNEARSAALFVETTGMTPPIGRHGVERVQALILATADHRATSDGSARLLLDLDLATLGASSEIYDSYAEAVRREYAHVDHEAWRFGRGHVLERFLARPAIYQTASFRQRLEEQARTNLCRELDALRA